MIIIKKKEAMLRILILLILFITKSCSTEIEPLNFWFPSFDSTSCSNSSKLLCMGSVNASSSLYLTTENETEINRIGRVLYKNAVPAWPASFSTTFTVVIESFRHPNSTTESGDGMSFIIAQDDRPSPPESYGSYLGILDASTQGGFLKQLAVELDTYKNEEEPDGNHIGIDTISVKNSLAIKSLDSYGINLKSGKPITINIIYDGWKKNLQIYAGYDENALLSILNHTIIMEDTVPDRVYVGFTGATGHVSETHRVLNWNFTSTVLPWESLHSNKEKGKRKKLVLIVVVPILVGFLILGLLVGPYVYKVIRRKNERSERQEDMEMLTRNAANTPTIYSYKKLLKATNKFSKDNLLGTGGFGSVYKGVLVDPPTTIAVKKISATSSQGEREYLAEICTIGRLRHKNLLQLHGWCHDRDQLLLVYEYMPNGSLDRFIGKAFLDWRTRYNILTGLASVLVYLHEECDNPVVHRDVKPNNVMLDSSFNAHLGDFGLARLIHKDSSVTTMVAGTPGYLAPEVSYTGRATPESDVYSFGMVVLEVVCGRRSKGLMEENSLVDFVWSSYEKGSLLNCIDEMLGSGDFDEEQVRRTLIVGLACLHPDYMLRPRMRKIVQVFMNPIEPLMNLPESRPSAVYVSLYSSSNSNTTNFGSNKAPPTIGSMESFPDEISVSYDVDIPLK